MNILYFALLVKKCRFNIFKHSISHILDGMGTGANGGGSAEQTLSKKGGAQRGIGPDNCFESYSEPNIA